MTAPSDSQSLSDGGIRRQAGTRRPPRDPLEVGRYTPQDARDWQKAFEVPFVPRGVYRFASHAKTDQWLWKMLSRPQVPLNPVSPPSSTSESSAST